MASTVQLIDLYPYVFKQGELHFLILKRAKNKIYAGQWRMIGGKVKKDEKRWQAAIRELNEETGLRPNKFWCVPTLNHFYEPSGDDIHLIPAFAAEIEPDSTIRLDAEHQEYKWVPSDKIEQYIYWPEQKRIITLMDRLILRDQILEDWIISSDHI
ncbi:MAG: NUDIX pyrophosphatase [Balneolaceae bacterium]